MIAERYPDGAAYLAMCRDAFAHTTAGGMVRLSWCGASLDAEGWRAEFRAALDRRVSARDVRPFNTRACRCQHCTARCRCGSIAPSELRKVPVPIVTLCGRCTRGKRADEDHERNLRNDQRELHSRVRVYSWRTAECRERFAHRIARHDD